MVVTSQKHHLTSDVRSVTELPPYDGTPRVETAQPKAFVIEPTLCIKVTYNKTEQGIFVAGEVVCVPRHDFEAHPVVVKLRCTEKSILPGRLARKTQTSTRTRLLAISTLSFGCSVLTKGKRYRLPFNLQLAGGEGKEHCHCGSETRAAQRTSYPHTTFPPSLCGTMKIKDVPFRTTILYYLTAEIENTAVITMKDLEFNPGKNTVDLAKYYDTKGLALEREYHTSTRVGRNWGKGGPRGVFLVSGPPLRVGVVPGQQDVYEASLHFMPGDGQNFALPVGQDAFSVRDVSFVVYKNIFAAQENIGNILDKTSTTTVTTYKVSLDDVSARFSVVPNSRPNTWTLKIFCSISEELLLDPPAFVSCLAAVLYEIEIKIVHTWGTSRLKVPLDLRSSVLPSYSAVSATPSIPSFRSQEVSLRSNRTG